MGTLSETLWKFRTHSIQVAFTYMEKPSFRHKQKTILTFPCYEFRSETRNSLQCQLWKVDSLHQDFSRTIYPILKLFVPWPSPAFFWGFYNKKWQPTLLLLGHFLCPVSCCSVGGPRCSSCLGREATWNIQQSVEPCYVKTSNSDFWWTVGGRTSCKAKDT